MILLIAGASHTGKTMLAQRLLEKYHYPYLSIDHLKMGLIRSGYTDLTPEEDDRLTEYLWPVVREIIKTAIENRQNLIVEGCYIPFDYAKDFNVDYLSEIRYCCLILSGQYIENHYADILAHASDIEARQNDSGCGKALLMEENSFHLEQCRKYGCPYVLIDGEYRVPDVL